MAKTNYSDDDMIKFLSQFTHSKITNTAKRTLTNQDAVALILGFTGARNINDIKTILRKWRNKSNLCYTYLFDSCKKPSYFYVGENKESKINVLRYTHLIDDNGNYKYGEIYWYRRTYWYRISRGKYAPTNECLRRIAELEI